MIYGEASATVTASPAQVQQQIVRSGETATRATNGA
jgi:hypothetical protein